MAGKAASFQSSTGVNTAISEDSHEMETLLQGRPLREVQEEYAAHAHLFQMLEEQRTLLPTIMVGRIRRRLSGWQTEGIHTG